MNFIVDGITISVNKEDSRTPTAMIPIISNILVPSTLSPLDKITILKEEQKENTLVPIDVMVEGTVREVIE